jgi:hypothetical protein
MVEMLAYEGLTDATATRRGIGWLLREQERDGSWFGRWGANYVYGTGAAVPALAAAGLREPGATGIFFALACLPDVAVAPLAGAAPPPWRWGAGELAISLGHHAAFALATSAARTTLAR